MCSEKGEISIINLPYKGITSKANPQDNELELVINTKKRSGLLKSTSNQSVFSIKKVHIFNSAESLVLDNVLKISNPSEIKVLKNKLKIIVGKDRSF